MDFRLRWLHRHLAIGLLLGLPMGLGGQLAIGLSDHETRPPLLILGLAVGIVASYVMVLMGIIGLFSTIFIHRRWGRITAVTLTSILLFLVVFAHLIGISVFVMAGDYPALASLQMIGDSPRQFFAHALQGTSLYIVAGIAMVALIDAIVCSALLKPDTWPLWQWLPLRACLVSLGLMVSTVTLGALFLDRRDVLISTPELAFLDSLSSRHSQAAQGELPVPQRGEERRREAEYWQKLKQSKGPRPNFLLLMLESVPQQHLSYYGYHRPVTPNLDAIARNSLRMNRAWSTSAQSNYAQMAILASLHPRRRARLDTYRQLDYSRVLPHDIFHKLGYKTATISSQDENWQGMRRFQTTKTPNYFVDSHDYPGPHLGREKKTPDHITVEKAIEWIEQQQVEGKPWQLYMNLQRTHMHYEMPEGFVGPYQPSEPTEATFGFLRYPKSELSLVINKYDNALAYVDEQIGLLVEYLRESGQLDHTLLVVVADHGEMFYEHGIVTHGKSLHELQTRVPLFIHWPAKITPRDSNIPVSTLDIMPTVLDLLGLPPHPSYQGVSFATPRRRAQDGTAIFMTLQGLRYVDGVVCWPWKLVHDWKRQSFHLYHLERDPEENDDLVKHATDVADVLQNMLVAMYDAQLAYHNGPLQERKDYYAPRLLRCPDLPNDVQ